MRTTDIKTDNLNNGVIITAGSTYLDVDAYACMVALRELLTLQGENAIAYSAAPYNYSVCKSLINDTDVLKSLPKGYSKEKSQYIIVDVSDPDYIKDSVPIDNITALYDHHTGFEEYWQSRIGDDAKIEFIGACATLVLRKWKAAGLLSEMTRSTALLLIAAILDNTLNLTSGNTDREDIQAFGELCKKESIDEMWCASYFEEVAANIESDLKNAIFSDVKTVINNPVLPPRFAQLCIWDAQNVILRLPEIRQWFKGSTDGFMINVIDIKHQCSYFVCDDPYRQKVLERIFGVSFELGIAKTQIPYLRKEIIKKVRIYINN